MCPNQLDPEEIIAVQDIILEFILTKGWKDYKNFARLLSERFLKSKTHDKITFQKTISNFAHPFFCFNDVSKKDFINSFPFDEISHRLSNMPRSKKVETKVVGQKVSGPKKSNVTLEEVFPEIEKIDIETGKSLVNSLDIYERVIQDALRDALREKKATNIFERKSDTCLEIADIEDFTLRIKGKPVSFSAVVKGYKSVGKAKTIVFEKISHQVFKANDTHPDHILLIVAKPLGDGVVSNLVKYGEDCGNRNLVITMDPVNVARFLRVRGII